MAEDTVVEIEDEEDDDIIIDVEDDTPEEDRGRDVAPDDSDDNDGEPDDEEMARYNKDAQARIRVLTKKRHDERRAKEEKARQLDEALTFAKNAMSEAERLRKQLGVTAKAAVGATKKNVEGEIASLKNQLAQALEDGDGAKAADLNEQLADAKWRLNSTAHAETQLADAEKEQPKQQQQQQQQQDGTDISQWPETRRRWAEENKGWFQKDHEATAVAYAVHAKLIDAGVKPDTEEYFKKVTEGVKKRFPEHFPKEGRRAESRVAAVDTDSGGTIRREQRGNKTVYSITRSQRALCDKLGITPKQYIEQVRAKEQG